MSRPAPFSYLSPEQQNKWGTSENYMANWQDPMQSQFNQIKNDPNRGNPWLDANTNGLFGPGLMGGAPRELTLTSPLCMIQGQGERLSLYHHQELRMQIVIPSNPRN